MVTLLVTAVLASAIALRSSSDFVARFGDLLAVLLYLFTPWTAINLVDFYLVRHGHYSIREIFNAHGMYRRWNWRGLAAYGLGFAAMIPFFSTACISGQLRAHSGRGSGHAGWTAVAGVAYLVACRSMNVDRDRSQAAAADAGLETADDPRLVTRL